MATPKKAGVRVTHQVWWEDCRPWIDQLQEDHGCLVHITISLPPSMSGLLWAVVVECHQAAGAAPRNVVWRDWRDFNPHNTGAAEAAALLLVTRALLALDNAAAEARAAQGRLWD